MNFFKKLLGIKEKKSFHQPYKTTKEITTKEIAIYFNTTQVNINKAFNILLYTEKNGTWTIVTTNGRKKGGIQKYNAKSKQKYAVWEEKILKDYELHQTIKALTESKAKNKSFDEKKEKEWVKEWSGTKKKTTQKEKIKKGEEYEEYIAKVYRSRGYHVSEYGKQMGREDHGIDLIAKKEKHLVLIQCKNWNQSNKWKITHKEIKVFQTEARLFVETKPLLRLCLLDARYIISGNFIHPSALKHIEEIRKLGKRVDYEIIEMNQ